MNFLQLDLKQRFLRLKGKEVLLVFLLLALALYANTLSYPFVHDDHIFIVGNPDLGRWDDLKDIFVKPAAFSFHQENIVNLYYRPVLEIVNKVLFIFFGRTPAGYHFFNIILHALNSFLVYILALHLFRRTFLAWAAGILFLAHPVQTETVCAIAGISNLLSVFLAFTSFYFYILAGDPVSGNKKVFGGASLILFICALLTKESTVIFPFLLVIYEFFVKGNAAPSRSLRNLRLLTGFFILLAVYFIFRKAVLTSFLPDLAASPYELVRRLLSIPQTLLMYFQILFVPCGLYYYRSIDILKPWGLPLMTLVTLGAVVTLFLKDLAKEERRLACFGLAWFFVALSPMLNILPLINEYSFILTSEHFLYFPFFGFMVFIFVIFRRAISALFGEKGARAAVAIFCLITFVFVLETKKQSRYWQGEIPLFSRTLQFEPNFGRVRLLLGRAYYKNGDQTRAEHEYKRALGIMERYSKKAQGTKAERVYRLFEKEIYLGLAQSYESEGRLKEAIYAYWQAQEKDPGDENIYNALGVGYLKTGQSEEAALCFKNALALKPDNILVLNNLAFYYLEKRNFFEARKILEKALALDPASVLTQRNLQEVLAAEKKNRVKNP